MPQSHLDCGINVCPTCGKILSHLFARPTRSAHDTFTFCERCTRLANVLTRHDSFSHARLRKKFWTCTKLFSPVSVWAACERTRCGTSEVLSWSAGYTSNKFLGRSSLVAHTVGIQKLAKLITYIIKCGIELLIHSQTTPCTTFSQRCYSAYEFMRAVIGNGHYESQVLDMT